MTQVELETKTCYVCGDTVEHEEDPLAYDGERRELCEEHWLAAYFLAMTRPEPPYVDVGLYQEATFYGRQLAATMLNKDPETVVTNESDNSE